MDIELLTGVSGVYYKIEPCVCEIIGFFLNIFFVISERALIIYWDVPPPQGLSEARRGKTVLKQCIFNKLVIKTAAGAPRRGAMAFTATGGMGASAPIF